ncbi:MAG: hypothetical protein LBB42_04615 [Coriobacteriales bacterium]|jgi:uracil-DNA glycosylase|nr:hypothetical protein [Coriobacteriales bacterium]
MQTMTNTKTKESQIAATLAARALVLEPFVTALNRSAAQALESMLLVVKGQCGAAENAGGTPFSGNDGAALNRAFEQLGWDEKAWCGLLLESSKVGSPKADSLTGEQLNLLIEYIDPVVIIALDEVARQTLLQSMLGAKNLNTWFPRKTREVQGRLLVSVDGFEAALGSDTHKQLVWHQLKQASYAEATKRFK